MNDLKDALRTPYAFPGGYTKAIYLADGERICPECARENYRQIAESTRDVNQDGWALGGVDIYWEGPPEHCVNCDKALASEYGDPE